ncbi:Uncharacterised protein [Rikenella microfusus]|uniref:Uncharacterized protein n=2 Tax=Rikenella microfusus TaxID=28139 RepID=A0A379MQV6_9BACT|nr:Uncharacterised protein [Rikenella microfusus]
MKLMRKFLLILLLILGAGFRVSAQISNVSFVLRNDKIYVTYQASIPAYHYLKGVTLSMKLNDQPLRPLTLNVSGDLGRVETSGLKTIVWDCFAENGNQPIEGDVQFYVEGTMIERPGYALHQKVYFGEYIWSPSAFYGIGFGFGKRWGAYMRYRFSAEEVIPLTRDSPNTPNGSYTTYETVRPGMTIAAGTFVRATKWLRFNAGLGYGEKTDLGTAEQLKGLAYEVGGTILFFRKKWLGFNFGYAGILGSKPSGSMLKAGEFTLGATLSFQ